MLVLVVPTNDAGGACSIIKNAIRFTRGHLDRISAPHQLVDIHRLCGERIVRVEVPLLPVFACQQIADCFGLLVRVHALCSIHSIHQLIAVDLAQRELMRIFGSLAFPGDVGQGRERGGKCDGNQGHDPVPGSGETGA